ncbi:MAG: hypothetical protein NVS3B21_08620 [Acidimicrobiales bacterium]
MALAGLLCVSGCGGAGHRGGQHRSGPPPELGRRYLELAAAANDSIAMAKTRLSSHPDDLTLVEADLRAIADAKRAFDAQVSTLSFPPSIRPVVERLLAADRTLEASLDAGAAARSASELNGAQPAIVDDGQAAVRAAAEVRRQLALPPLG